MDAPHLEAALSAAPEFAARLQAEAPGYGLGYFWKRAPQSLDELTTNARLTAESFRGRAQGGWLADRIVPDWSVLMVQFQNLDPFQHRVWPYLNVDETGVDRPDWNTAAAEVIRGLDEAIGRLCELAEKRKAAVMMVSDHGFGPCLGRIHVNRILVKAGVARLPGWAGLIGRRTLQASDHLRLWGQKRDNPAARSASFDQSVTAQYPFDWKRTLAFAPHQDTAAMVYVNCAARHGGVKTAAPRMTPRQIDEARSAAAFALADAKHPETGSLLFPQIIATAETYQIDPTREGYPDLIALPDEPYWVRTKLTSGTVLGRARSQPPRYPPARGNRRPGRRGSVRRPQPQGPSERRHTHDPRPPGTSHPGPYRGQTDRRLDNARRVNAQLHPNSPGPRGGASRRTSSQAVRVYAPASNRSSSSALLIWDTWNDQIKSNRRRGV